jgi:hypothetical protein
MKAIRGKWLVVSLLVVGLFGFVSAARAQADDVGDIAVQISREETTIMAGDWVDFATMLRNDGSAATPPLAVHLSVAAVEKGHHVDPEDWSPQRTQFLPPLGPGESVTLNWRLHALFAGEFASFITVVSPTGGFVPAMSIPLRLHITPDNILPLNQVIPVVTAVPLFPLALLLVTRLAGKKRRSG